ncbi:MAG: DUF4333 domain-containing protein [Microthrixaceae bacterium]|nr:DUF4333 domain-containing protein [Microthrixaceae bacterium]MCO5319881.1 DUF4333 domain-containing protein [Microthrixaceae bacterium]
MSRRRHENRARAIASTALWLALSLALVAGCSGGADDAPSQAVRIDPQRAAEEVAASLETATGQAPDSVSCPEGISAEPGAVSRCQLVDGSATYGVTVTLRAREGDEITLDVAVDSQPEG